MQELRDAGAEAIEINGIRVVVDTWFADARDAISVSGTQVTQPFEIPGHRRPGNHGHRDAHPRRDRRHRLGPFQDGSVVITELDEVEILSTVNLPEPDPNVTVTD